ncbi:hypothetical protein MKW98_024329, partial [Papaver atlanticum]
TEKRIRETTVRRMWELDKRSSNFPAGIVLTKLYLVGAGAQEKAVPSKREERDLL